MMIRRLSGLPGSGWGNFWDELDRLRKQMSSITERYHGGTSEQFAGVFPLINVTEDKDNYYIRAELPGIKAEDLELSVTGETLSISGERKLQSEGEQVRYHRREREGGKFNRIFTLPGLIDTDKVEAKNSNGILTITLPKSEKTKPKQISVKNS
ncbi:MAG TPA: Hsp20/alpha crystallin family protein [Thermodesulfobacteriota bacterium]|nr:Hsp20/alpha crystallin family protein [Thermodesulfobacteriota bacterium]